MDNGNTEQQSKPAFAQISFAIKPALNRPIKTDDQPQQKPQELDYITSISDNTLESVVQKNLGPLVIPLANPNEVEIPLHLRNKTNNGPKKEDLMFDENGEELDEDEKFRRDVEWRPESATIEQYESVSVEAFGAAMLRGMGWKPGQAIGGVNKALVQPIEFIGQAHRLGLGAKQKQEELPPNKKKYIKPGESREPKQEMELPEGPDGRKHHIKSIDQKLKPKVKAVNGISVDSIVSILWGVHEGLYARVIELRDSDATVEFPSEETARVNISDLEKVDTSKLSRGHPALTLIPLSNSHTIDPSTSRSKSQKLHSADSPSSSSKYSSRSSNTSNSPKVEECWLRPNIMVRIVSKSFCSARYYNKKVLIVDVVGKDECVVQIDGGKLIEGVKQRMLETVLPPDGGQVIVVRGSREYRNKVGTVYQRNRRDETVTIQMIDDDDQMVTLPMDDVAQLVGDAGL